MFESFNGLSKEFSFYLHFLLNVLIIYWVLSNQFMGFAKTPWQWRKRQLEEMPYLLKHTCFSKREIGFWFYKT